MERKSVFIIALLIILAFASTVFADYTRIADNTVPAYTNSALTKRNGNERVDKGDRVTVHQETSNAYYVTYPVRNGTKTRWVPKNIFNNAPAPVQEQDGYIKTNGARLNFRNSPNGTIIDKINNGTAVKVLAHNNPNGWSKIRYNGREGYASSQYVVIGKIPDPTPATTQFRYPLNNIYVCGNNWMTKYSKRPSRPYHAGIDVKSSSGDKTVYATADGTVAASGWNSANGNFVIIQHVINGKTIYSFYCHMSKRSVNKGNSVKSGTPIGIIGNTGSASAGEHLHFTFVDKLMTSGGYWGYVTTTGNAVTYQGYTFYSPAFVIDNQRLP